MTYVHLKDVNVSIPVYDSHALRLITLPPSATSESGPTLPAAPTVSSSFMP